MTTGFGLAVLTRLRLVVRVIASLSVAVLFAAFGSVTVAGVATEAVLTAFCARTAGLAMSAAPKTMAAAMERRALSTKQVRLASTETPPGRTAPTRLRPYPESNASGTNPEARLL